MAESGLQRHRQGLDERQDRRLGRRQHPRRLARHPLRIGGLRGRALLQDAARARRSSGSTRTCAGCTTRRASTAWTTRSISEALHAGRRRHRQGQRPRRVLHPPADLSRLPRARRQPAALPGRRGDSRVGMGRVPRRRTRSSRASTCASARGRAARRTRSRRWRSRSPTTPTPASSRWRPCSTATARASRSTRRPPQRRQRPEPVPRARRDPLHAAALRVGAAGHHARQRHDARAGPRASRSREQDLPREMLYVADEVFFAGTAAEITPIRSVDKIQIGAGRRGPVTDRAPAGVLRLHQRRRARPARLADAGRDPGGKAGAGRRRPRRHTSARPTLPAIRGVRPRSAGRLIPAYRPARRVSERQHSCTPAAPAGHGLARPRIRA